MACWDLIGEKLDAPVWQLLGGSVWPRLRAYANGWYSGPRNPKGLAEAARSVVELGYTALKFDPFGHMYKNLSSSELREALNLVAAVPRGRGRRRGPDDRGPRPLYCSGRSANWQRVG